MAHAGVLRGVLGNAATVTAFRLAADVALLGFVMVLSRRYGAEGMGSYAYSIAVAAIAFSIPQYALSGLLVAQGSASYAAFASLWRPLGRLNQLLCALAALVIVLVALAGHEETREILLLAGLAQWCYAAGEVHRAAFAAHEQSGRIAWAELLYKAAIPLFAVPAMLAGASLTAVMLALPAAGVVYLIAVTVAARRFRPDPAYPAITLPEAGRRSAPFVFNVALAAPIYRLQPVVLAAFGGLAGSGLYSAAFKPIETGMLLFGAMATALMPALVKWHADDDRHAHDAGFASTALAALAIAVVGAAAGIALAPWIIPLVFGPEFEAAVPAFRVLCLVLPASALRNLFLAGLTSSGRLHRWTAAQAAALAAAAGAALVLVPPFGLMGAAVGLAAGESLACVAAWWLWRRGPLTPPVPASDATVRTVASPRRG